MSANAGQRKFNRVTPVLDEDTVLATRNKPLAPATSWWLEPRTREQFNQAIKREADRMAGSPLPTVARAIRKIEF